MEVDWERKLKPNYTSCGCMLMEVDWRGKLIINSMVDWQMMKLTPMDRISEVDWGGMVLVPTIRLSSCSLKLIGELMTQVSSFSGKH